MESNTAQSPEARIQAHRQYLKDRMSALLKKHTELKATEAETPDPQHALAMNSIAAGVFDTVYELQHAINNLDADFPELKP